MQRAGSLGNSITGQGDCCHREVGEEGSVSGQERILEIFQFLLLMLRLFLK